MAKYRFKTEQEFKDEGLWSRGGFPNTWNSFKKMNHYLGKDVPDKFNKDCAVGNNVFLGDWTFNSDSYTLNSLVGRYVKYAKWTPDNPGLRGPNGYDKIIEDIPGKDIIELECYSICARKRLIDGDLELMPLGFTPPTDSTIPILKQDLAGRWIRWNVQTTRRGLTYKVGEYSQIEKIDFIEDDVYLHGNIAHFTNSRLVDGDWELMPIDFIPSAPVAPVDPGAFDIKNLVGRWIRWNVDCSGNIINFKVGDYSRIQKIHPSNVILEGETYYFSNIRLKDGDWEIMPEGFVYNENLVIAEKRYPSGTKVSNKNLGYTCEFTINDSPRYYVSSGDNISVDNGISGSYTLYKDGRWANVIKTGISFVDRDVSKWAVKVKGPSTEPKYAELAQWRSQNSEGSWRNPGYIHSDKYYGINIQSGYTEVSYDYFLENIYKKEFMSKTAEPSKVVSDDIFVVGKKLRDIPFVNKYITCYKDGEGKLVFSNLGYNLAEYPNKVIRGVTKDYFDVEGFGYGWFKKSDALEQPDKLSLSSFPTEGSYELSDPGVQELLSLLEDTRPSPVSRNPKDMMVAWNARSYWYVSTMSGKPRYTYANLRPFLDKQLKKSSSSQIDSSVDIPKFIEGKWYKNLGDAENYAGCFDHFDDNRFYLKAYYDFGDKTFREETSGWLSCTNAVECTEEDLKIIFASNPTENPMYKESSKFIVGKWYVADSWDKDSFVKFESVSSSNNDRVHFTESICKGTYRKKELDWWGDSQSMKEVDMKQVSKYLPVGHPDKIVDYGTIDLLKEARKRYPIGTKGNNKNLGIDFEFTITGTNFEYSEDDTSIIAKGDSTSIGAYRTVYKNGVWAEITSLPTVYATLYPEYYEFTGESCDSFTNRKIYKIVNPADLEGSSNFIDNKGKRNGWSGGNYKRFKPSTKEAYDKQQNPKEEKVMTIEYSPHAGKFVNFRGEKCEVVTSSRDNPNGLYLKVKSGAGWTLNQDSLDTRKQAFPFNPKFIGSNVYWTSAGYTFIDESTLSTCPFKEGDKVIGISEACGITTTGWVGKILRIFPDSAYADIQVTGIGKSQKGSFEVHSKHFRIATHEELRQGECLDPLDLEEKSTESIINVAKRALPQTITVKERPII